MIVSVIITIIIITQQEHLKIQPVKTERIKWNKIFKWSLYVVFFFKKNPIFSLQFGNSIFILHSFFFFDLHRLYPVAPFLTRYLSDDLILGGYHVPKGVSYTHNWLMVVFLAIQSNGLIFDFFFLSLSLFKND